MQSGIDTEKLKRLITSHLPELFRTDSKLRRLVLDITHEQYANKQQTEGRIEALLDELRRDREEQQARWEENQKEIRENQKEIKEMRKAFEQGQTSWKQLDQSREEERKEHRARWEENQKEIRESQKDIREMLSSQKAFEQRLDSSIGSLGARWGIQTEASFRNGLAGIIEESFDVKVERYLDVDQEGDVFGRPDQVEMDVIIHDGVLILCEIKSSMSRSDMYTFHRKCRFYEKRHSRQADRMVVISPMVEERARQLAEELGVEVYSWANQVTDFPRKK